MIISHLKLSNWKNFKEVSVSLTERMFLVGPNASGKSNFLDVFRFVADIVRQGGGLQKALQDRGGISKIRCLAARNVSDIKIEIHLSDTEDKKSVLWKYILGLGYEGRGRQRSLITREEVWRDDVPILQRPDEADKKDTWLLTATHLEQLNSNIKFRNIYTFFKTVNYLHLIPQLIRHPELFFNSSSSVDNDSYGFRFLEKIANTSETIRAKRFKKIEDALRTAVPQLKDLKICQDRSGIPHLEALYEHWRPNAGKQQEEQFSDGTLRLIGLLWSILEVNGILLLEEPELSLHSAIIKKLPALFHKITNQKNKKIQLFISTHSFDLLCDAGIGGEEILLFTPELEGTTVIQAASNKDIKKLLEGGLTPAEAVIPYTEPKDFAQSDFFHQDR